MRGPILKPTCAAFRKPAWLAESEGRMPAQVQIKFQVKGFQLPVLQQGVRQLEDHARAAQVGIRAVFLNFGIDHRHGVRTAQRPRFMVVQNDDVYSQAVEHLHFLYGGGAAVHRNEQAGFFRTFAEAAFYARFTEPVAFPRAHGNEVLRVQVIGHQNGPEKRHGGDPVHVIVPVNAHGFPFIHRLEDAVHGGPHFPHQERVAQMGEPGLQKEVSFRSSGKSALQQKLFDQQGQFCGKRFQDRIILPDGGAESPMKARCHGSILAPHPTGSRLFPQQAAKAGRRRCLTCFRENGRRSRRNAGSSFPHDAWKRPSRCISIFSKRKAPSGENPDGAAASGISA